VAAVIILWLVLGVVVVVGLSAVLGYNRFVRQRSLIDDSWSNIDTELTRRYDLIPNLVQTVQGYASHERSTLEAVTAARSQAMDAHGDPEDQARSENVLVGSLKSLLAVSEAYPDLKASAGFADLQRQLTATEDRIQAARRLYNNNVRDYNQRVQSVPTNLIARLGGFAARQYFQIDEAVDTRAPSVAFDGSPAAAEPDGPHPA
jgi:LemA protein